MKTVSIIQSNYVPWKGYFDIIGQSDEFILLDTVQFTKNDWRNRNRIKVSTGQPWLTIPVKTGGRFGQTIAEAEIDDPRWTERHWSKVEATYRGLAGFRLHGPAIAAAYEAAGSQTLLSAVNRIFIERICQILGIRTRIADAADYAARDEKTDRVIDLCKAAGATHYLSGPAAQAYIDDRRFRAEGLGLVYMDYAGYPEYAQVNPPFEHAVSILDLLFCAGEDALRFMKFPAFRAAHPWADPETPPAG